MSYKPYTNYEVTIRKDGKRIKTIPFGKLDTVKKFIDGIVEEHIKYENAQKIIFKDEYKIILLQPNCSYRITVCKVHRDFMNMEDLFK
jgi:hypothetical protein